MPSPNALFRGLISRLLPQPDVDGPNNERAARMGRYGDVKVESSWPTDHLLADEGATMVASMLPGATALQLGVSASFLSTAAAFVLGNSDVANGKRLYPKFLRLNQSTAPAAGVDLRYAIVLDSKDRTPTTIANGSGGSGPGTPATGTAYRAPVVCTNMDVNPQIVGVPFFPLSTTGGATPTIPSPGSFARTIIGNGYIKASVPVVKDQYILTFGAADAGGGTFQAAAALAKIVENAPAVVVGPGQFMVIYIWSTTNSANGNAWDDAALGWTEK